MSIKEFSNRKALDPNERDWIVTNLLLEARTKQIINFTVLQLYDDQHGKSHSILLYDFSHGTYNIH